MNGVSLRVSSIRGNENIKKNSEMRMNLFQVPAYYKQTDNKFLSNLSNATTVEDQIKLLKEFAEHVKFLESSFMGNIQILTNLFIEAPPKHAIKNTICKFFGQLKISKDAIKTCLTKSIISSIERCEQSTDNIAERNFAINAIGSCFENFKLGVESVKYCLKEILGFFQSSLIIYNEHLHQQISPSDKSEISLFIHSTIRFTISCFNQYPDKLKQMQSAELDQIAMLCSEFLDYTDIPMDTKTNCGILITMKANIDDKFDDIVDDTFLEQRSAKKLCLLNGIVCTIKDDYEDFNIYYRIVVALKEISDFNSVEPVMILGVCRALVQLAKKLLSLNISSQYHEHLKEILTINLEFSLSHLEHHMDSVRHLCKELLKHTIQLGILVDNSVNDIVYNYIKNSNLTINTKCILIISISSVVKAEAVLHAVPNLIEDLLKSLVVKDPANINLHINNCYEVLMMSHGCKLDKIKWFQKWVHPLLMELESKKQHYEIRETLSILIQKAIKTYPEIVSYMMENRNNTNFGLMLSSLGIARKSGLFDQIVSTEIVWKNTLSYDDIKTAMVSANDGTRVAALNLIAECHKTTEVFIEAELECILFFLENNVNVQSPSVRQKIMNAMKNAISRLKAGFATFIKKRMKVKNHYYYGFVKNLHQFCINNLFDGANYSRRLICFKILIQLLQIMKELFAEQALDIWTEEQVHTLLNSLNDSYESNKALCIEVLAFCPKNYLATYNDTINYEVSQKMMTSVKPGESLSAAYFLEYLCTINPSLEVPIMIDVTSDIYPTLYKALHWCDYSLQNALKVAQTSLLVAARENPLYGTLFCIRHLMSKVDLKTVAKCSLWREYILCLLKICRELTQVVSVVVNNSSPEGHLPNDFSDVDAFIHDDEDVDMEEDNQKTTPQMVLLCSWRVIKEVSLILGDIAFKCPVIRTQKSSVNETCEYGLLDCNQILGIGAHFTELLSETKHRGAFEQAYIGFSKLCIRLWGAQETELHTLPLKWLDEMIITIAGNEFSNPNLDIKTDKMCATRRSAGVPFMMQALITSELQVGSTKGLQFCMRNLIEICKSAETTESRTHSLNILRTLFRCTDLGDSVGEFISEGIICAINGYDAESWSERNSSTLLFSALMIRVFGVQRTKDSENLDVRNKMTGRIFFLRYPQLYDFFMNELKDASQIILAGSRSKKLHPLLLLLSRLYPSALEGSESNLKLSRFVPIVATCSGCAELQTRHLAAKFIAIIVSPDLIFDRTFLLMECLNRSAGKNVNSNSVHGTLLQILYLIRTNPLKPIRGTYALLNHWVELYTSISNYLFEVKHNFVLYGTILDILLEILARCQHVIFSRDEQYLDDLNNIVDYLLNLTKQKQVYYASTLILKKIVLIKLIMSMHSYAPEEDDDFLSEFDVKHKEYEFNESMMNIILLILDFDYISEQADEYELDKMEIDFIQNLNTTRSAKIGTLKQNIMKSKTLHTKLKEIIEANSHYNSVIKAYTIISYTTFGIEVLMDSSRNLKNLKALSEIAVTKPTQLKTAIFKCVKRCFGIDIKSSKPNKDIDIHFLLSVSSPENCYELRDTAVHMLRKALKRFNKTMSFKFYAYYSASLLLLLRDDDEDIRIKAAEIVTDLYNRNEEMEIEVVLPSFAQKLYIQTLCKTLLILKYDVKEIITMILIIMANENDCDGSDSESEYRIFDKNEVNIYGEVDLLKEYCINQINNLSKQFSVNIDETRGEFIEIAKKRMPTRCIIESCIEETKSPLKLINVIKK